MYPTIQRDTATITAGNTELLVDITPVPVGKTFAKITHRTSSGSRGYNVIPELTTIVDDKYTQIKLTRVYSTYDTVVEWQVIYDYEFVVQHGVYQYTGSGTVSIDTVDLTKTWVIAETTSAACISSKIVLTENEIQFDNTLGSWQATTSYFIVSRKDATVISGSASLSSTTATVTVSEYDLDTCLLEYSYGVDYTNVDADGGMVRGRKNTTTSIVFDRSASDGPASITYWIVTWPGLSTQQVVGSDAGTTLTLPISAVNQDASWCDVSIRLSSATSYGAAFTTAKITSNTSLYIRRAEVTGTMYYSATVISFEPTLIFATPNYPNDVAVMPNESNTFTADIVEGVTITAYEIQHREIGGVWTSTGEVIDTDIRHVFTAGTFELGKQYEWQVRVKVAGQTGMAAWSPSALFNTVYPIISNPTPAPDSSIRVDIRDFGGRLKSPYGRDIQLTIEIADNAAYTSATTYTLPVVESGTEAIMQHAIQEGGTWHVRMTATDSETLKTVLEYSFFAGQFIQFITLPGIQQEPQQATHVTVRVRDTTTTEYTAIVDPAPPADRKVEWLFYIKSGTQATCQTVAEAFLAKLGRPQVKVSGRIPLTVTLRLKQKVRTVIPDAGINEEMILRKKRHEISRGRVETTVELGDIVVSDNELVSRILERLEVK